LAEYEQRRGEFESRGAKLAALSVDAAPRSEAVRKQFRLAFPILCDPSRDVVRAWDLLNAEEKGGVAHSATFVLASDRRVEFATRDRVTNRVLAPDLLGWMDAAAPAERHRIDPGVAMWATVTKNVLLRGLRQR